MADLRTAAQQALERLMLHHRTWDARDDLNAITSLKAALAQPEQEPTDPPRNFDEAVSWAAWQVIEGMTKGQPLRHVVHGVLQGAVNIMASQRAPNQKGNHD